MCHVIMPSLVKMLPWRKLAHYSKSVHVSRRIVQRSMSQFYKNEYFVWIDLEMTGLNENVHHIIEVACLVTNPNLDRIGNGIHLVVHQSKEVHDKSEKWPLLQHEKSGLREASINSKISITEADNKVFHYIKSCIDLPFNRCCYLAGNSVYMDKRFIEKYMPLVNSLLHYRILDVSSIKILYQYWFSKERFRKTLSHRALEDVEETINELKFYRERFFKTNL